MTPDPTVFAALKTHWNVQSPITKLVIFALTVTSIFFAGLALGYALPDPTLPFIELRSARKDQYSLISPLLQCGSERESSSQQIGQLKSQVRKSIEQAQKVHPSLEVSVSYYDLSTGAAFGIDQVKKFAPASLVKLPVLFGYYKLAEKNPALLAQEIEVTEEYLYENIQNVLPEERLEVGRSYTVDDLLRRMIVYSDNYADQLLREQMPEDEFFGIFDAIGVDLRAIALGNREDIVTVQEYSLFFRILYNASYLTDEYSETALQLLVESQYSDGLKAGVDSNTRVAHKFGERRYLETGEFQLHDCGIVYASSGPYVLCVMTRGSDFELMEQTIQEISRKVFTFR